MTKVLRDLLVTGAVAASICVLATMGGCSQADDVKVVDAPPVDTRTPQEPPKIPTQKKAFTESDMYRKYMGGGGRSSESN